MKTEDRLNAYARTKGIPALEDYQYANRDTLKDLLIQFYEKVTGHSAPKKWTKTEVIQGIWVSETLPRLTPRQRRRHTHKNRHIAAAGRTKQRKFRLKFGAQNRRR